MGRASLITNRAGKSTGSSDSLFGVVEPMAGGAGGCVLLVFSTHERVRAAILWLSVCGRVTWINRVYGLFCLILELSWSWHFR